MEIKQYIYLLWQWLWIIVLGIVLSAVIAFVISLNTDPVYSATTYLLLEQPEENSGSIVSELEGSRRQAETYVQLIQKQPVYQGVIDTLGLTLKSNEFQSLVSVSQVPNTGLIAITVENTDPRTAALIANELVTVFQGIDEARQDSRYAEAINGWENALTKTQAEIDDLQLALSGLSTDGTLETENRRLLLQSQLNNARDTYNSGFNQLQELRIDLLRNSSSLTVVEKAVVPLVPIRPRTVTNTLLAAIVGGMLAVGIVFLIDFLDDKLRFPSQIGDQTGLSTLGAIPNINENEETNVPIAQREPRSPTSEAFRLLRTNLSFFSVDEPIRRLLVTSAIKGEGKTTTASNLAVVMAQSGKRVVIIDTDLRRPRLHRMFGIGNNVGLTNLLLEDDSQPVTRFLQKTETPGLKLITSGPMPPNPAELLGSQRMEQVLSNLDDLFDVIILDSPPVLTVADAAVLAPSVDGLMLVSRIGYVDMGAVVQAVELLRAAETPITGIVANDFSQRQGGYYYYSYYSYQYRYGEEAVPRSRLARLVPSWIMNLLS